MKPFFEFHKVGSLTLDTSLGGFHGDTDHQTPSEISKSGYNWGFYVTNQFLLLDLEIISVHIIIS